MKRKKKERHRENTFQSNVSSEDVVKNKIFKNYIIEMEEKTKEFAIKNPNLMDKKFHLFQTNKNSLRDMIFNLAYFYDTNYTGNKDFIHIPNINDILNNIKKYPIMLCTQKDKDGMDDILGVSTVKFENNDSISNNPYFPTVNETILTITGILTKLNSVDKNNNKIRGIGKELFKSSIRAAYRINKENKVRLICEIDCRNVQSFSAVTKAVKELQEENIGVSISVDGYYEILDASGNLTEAPTFILEIELNGKDCNMFNEPKVFNYLNCKRTELFSDLNNVIENNTKELKEYVNVKGDKIVIYHELEKFNALNVTLNIGNTAEGNERVPSIRSLQYENAPKDLM